MNLRGDRARDLTLQREYITQVAVIALSPDQLFGRGINQLGRDANPLAGALNRTLHDIGDVQVLCDLPDRNTGALIARHGCARNDPKGFDTGERSDELLAHAIREIILVLPSGEISKKKHRERRLGLSRQGRPRRTISEVERDIWRKPESQTGESGHSGGDRRPLPAQSPWRRRSHVESEPVHRQRFLSPLFERTRRRRIQLQQLAMHLLQGRLGVRAA